MPWAAEGASSLAAGAAGDPAVAEATGALARAPVSPTLQPSRARLANCAAERASRNERGSARV